MPKPAVVTLQKYEQYVASCVGVRRRIASWEYHTNQSGKDGWNIDVESACAEMAAGKYFDLYWDGSINTFKRPDLSHEIQIRNTLYATGKLIVRPDDNKQERYVLVCGSFPVYFVCGWLYGYEAEDDKYWDNPNDKDPAWLVPQSDLRDIETLREMVIQEKYEHLHRPR